MERKDIPQQLTWDTAALYADDDAWDKAFAEMQSDFSKIDFGAFSGKLADKQTLLACFKTVEEVGFRLEKMYIYAHLRGDEDLRSSRHNAALSRLMAYFSKISAEISYIDSELTALPDETLQAFIADPDFVDYDYRLRTAMKSKAHVLSAAEEKLLALGGDVMGGFQNIFMMLDNANLNLPKATFKGEEVQMTHGMYGVVLHTGTAEERRTWYKKYYQAYRNLIDAITQAYYYNVKKDVYYATVRHYDSCLAKALDGEDVSPVVYNNLIEATHGALPYLHEYIYVRKQVLGLEEQHPYDLFVPLVENADICLPFEEAYELVIEGLAPLGEDYQNLLRKARKERWMDVCENEGKRSGAYSSCVYSAPHPYVLLNYQQTTNDVFTIAHEMGHAMHSYKSNAAQPASKADYTIFLAEIASTVNEVLLLKHLYNKTDDVNLKKYLLAYYMDSIRSTLFRQTQFAEFEQLAHAKAEAGEPLTKESLNDIYYSLNKQYYGDGLVHDEDIAYEWARIPHFYTSFYVYKYATGIISAISIVKRILTEGEGAVQDYFAFLSAGGSEDPVSILKKAGVDLTTNAPFEAAMEEFKNTLEEFKSLL